VSDFHSPIARDGVAFEAAAAKHDVQATAQERGQSILFYVPDEANLNRSKYNSIKSRSLTPNLSVYAFPIDFNPSRYLLEKVGFSDDIKIVAFTPLQSWEDLGITIEDIDLIRWRMKIEGREYEISDKKEFDQQGDTFLYIVLGGRAL